MSLCEVESEWGQFGQRSTFTPHACIRPTFEAPHSRSRGGNGFSVLPRDRPHLPPVGWNGGAERIWPERI